MRIVTINTWQGRGPYRARVAALTEQLVALQPDIIAAQETLVASDGSADTTAVLAKALGLHAVFHPQRQQEETLDGYPTAQMWGLSVLARWPIVETHVCQPPWDPADGERPALLCAIAAPAGLVRLVSLHLTHLKNDPVKRQQLEAIVNDPWLAQPAAARLLGGDFNQTLDGPSLDWLLAGERHPWHVLDTYRAGDGAAGRATMSPRNSHTPQIRDDLCIDFIFSLAPTPDQHPAFARSAVVLDRPSATGVFPSDHFGVATAMTLATPEIEAGRRAAGTSRANHGPPAALLDRRC
ncbi:MAG: hypothetical protein H0V24_13660 [Chloroflexia bacterium]|nr:hypothetical protein [Chloroflexia bacterium]